MDIVLMHKNDMVAKIVFTDAGYFKEIEGFYNKMLMPPGTRVPDTIIEQRFKSWLEQRCIPKDRNNYIKILSDSGVNSQEQFYFKNYGLSLTDCYWLRSFDSFESNFGWDELNFFNNTYSDYVGNILTDSDFKSYSSDYISPDLTTNGLIDKMWYQDNLTLDSYLLKFGTKKNNYKEIYFECAAAKVAERLNIAHNNCTLVEKQLSNGSIINVSMSKNFCNENIELVPAQMLSVEPGIVGKNGLLNYIKRIGLKSEIDKMIVFDYIVCNPERNLSNFGFLRDSNNFKSLGLAPLYGNSQCLWMNWEKNGVNQMDDAKPFDITHEKQIELVDDFSWIDFDNLYNVEIEIKQILRQGKIQADIQEKICMELQRRINKLSQLSQVKQKNTINNKKIIQNTKPDRKIILSQPSDGFGN